MAKQSKLDFLKQGDAGTLRAAEDVLSGGQRKGFFARLFPFLGPAFIASVAYVDPGNYATNILKETAIDLTFEVLRGEPAKTIIRASKKAKADLIVLGTHGKTGTDAFWSGSVTPRVCAGCDVPILLVPVKR